MFNKIVLREYWELFLCRIRMFCLVVTIFFGFLCPVTLYAWVRYWLGKQKMPNVLWHLVIWAVTALLIIMWIYIERRRKKNGGADKFVEPYIVYFHKLTIDQLIEKLSGCFDLHELEYGLCSLEGSPKKLCTFSYFSKFNEEEFEYQHDAFLEKAWDYFGLKQTASLYYFQNIIPIYVGVYDYLDDKSREITHLNAIYGISSPSPVVNFYIDLSKGALIIPALRYTAFRVEGYSGPNTVRYYQALKYISKKFEALCT